MRKATLSDAPAIFNLVNAAYGLETGYSGLAFKRASRYPTLDEVEAEVLDFWVLESAAVELPEERKSLLLRGLESSGGAVAGCVRVVVKEDVAYIGPLAVWPQLKGLGLGRRLLSMAESMAPVAQVDTVSCRTDLIPWYEKMGYQLVGSYPAEDYVPKKNMTRDGLKMIVMQRKNN